MPTIEIQALDTLFFRDGKPFEMGEDNWAEGIFPPPPSVIYGALRSAYFAENIGELDKANTDDDPTKDLHINQIYIGVNGRVHLPLPLDFFELKDENKNLINQQALSRKYKVYIHNLKQELLSSNPFSEVFCNEEQVNAINDGILPLNQIQWYLNGLSERKYTARKMSDLVINEPKVGNALNNDNHSASTGKLYRIGMQRLENISLFINYSGLSINKNGLAKLGAENKAVKIKENTEFDDFKIDTQKEVENFKIIFTTPVFFKSGWIPEWIDSNTKKGIINGQEITLTNAFVGNELKIGGFDVKTKQPKTMLKAVPAGSVYYFTSDSKINIEKVFPDEGLCDNFPMLGTDFNKQGFGKFLKAKL